MKTILGDEEREAVRGFVREHRAKGCSAFRLVSAPGDRGRMMFGIRCSCREVLAAAELDPADWEQTAHHDELYGDMSGMKLSILFHMEIDRVIASEVPYCGDEEIEAARAVAFLPEGIEV